MRSNVTPSRPPHLPPAGGGSSSVSLSEALLYIALYSVKRFIRYTSCGNGRGRSCAPYSKATACPPAGRGTRRISGCGGCQSPHQRSRSRNSTIAL
eukprot:1193947-Prorocentrum_minimum.AAC.1